MVVAIDGPSGVGKSTLARRLAERLGWTYLDTGAMYRAVTVAWLRDGAVEARLRDTEWLRSLRLDIDHDRVLLDGEDVGTAIRDLETTRRVSQVAAEPAVRRRLTELQRRIGALRPCVLEGRDIGTVVFPDAFFKVFLTASDQVRAHRRWLQMGGPNSGMAEQDVLADQQARDRKDSERSTAPLKRAEDAMTVETDRLDENQALDLLYRETVRRLEA